MRHVQKALLSRPIGQRQLQEAGRYQHKNEIIIELTYQGDTFDKKCRKAKEALHDETSEDTLYFRNSRASCIFRHRSYKMSSYEGKTSLQCRHASGMNSTRVIGSYRKHDKYYPTCWCNSAPWTPRFASIYLVTLNLPATELLVQPPPI